MGIKDLFKFLTSANITPEQISIDEYANENVAVDISGFFYRFKQRSQRDPRSNHLFLDGFVYLLCRLKSARVHPVFVFDGAPPKEKEAVIAKRKQNRQGQMERVTSLEEAIARYKQDKTDIDQVLLDEMASCPNPPLRGRKSPTYIDLRWLEGRLSKINQNIISITETDRQQVRKLIELSGQPMIVADGDAEALCANLCLHGQVAAVITEDSDVLAYGPPTDKPVIMLKDFNDDGYCLRMCQDEVLSELKMPYETFLDFCIMCGTDYNDRIKGVGPGNAYKLLAEYGAIENLPAIHKKKPLDTSVLLFEQSRKMFHIENKIDFKIRHNVSPDLDQLFDWLLQNNRNTKVTMALLQKSFTKPKITFLPSAKPK